MFEFVSPDPPKTHGWFRWKISRGNKTKIGDVVGCLGSDGYWSIQIDGKRYNEHRLVWLYQRGKWPKNQLDHINRDRSDNRLINLREATNQQNCCNKAGRNRIGYKNIYPTTSGNYQVQCILDNTTHCLGTYKTISEAVTIRNKWIEENYGEFACKNLETLIS